MTVEDLVAVQANAGVRVRTSKTASLPGLMSALLLRGEGVCQCSPR